MSKEPAEFLQYDVMINLKAVFDTINSLKSKDLARIGVRFDRGLMNVKGLFDFPVDEVIKVQRTHEAYINQLIVRFFESSQSITGPLTIGDIEEIMSKSYDDLYSLPKDSVEKINEIRKTVRLRFGQRRAKDIVHGSSIQSLHYAATVLLWTSFETLVADLFEYLLNVYPNPYAQYFLANRKARKNSIKNVEWHMPEIGTYLRKHPNVYRRSIDKIRELFEDIFPLTSRKQIAMTNLLSMRGIQELDYARNVIVHSAGEIDEKYLFQMGYSDQQELIGTQLKLTGFEVSNFSTYVVLTGIALLQIFDDCLMAKSLRRADNCWSQFT